MESLILALEPIDLLADKMRFKLPRTPSYLNAGPAVSVKRNAQPLPVFDGRWLLLFFLEHQVFKAFWVTEHGDVDTTLPVKVVIHLADMVIHFRKFHARVCPKDRVYGQTSFNHQQEHSRTVLTA